jgi:hypothetical protein
VGDVVGVRGRDIFSCDGSIKSVVMGDGSLIFPGRFFFQIIIQKIALVGNKSLRRR